MKYFTPEVKHGIVHRYPEEVRRKYIGWPTICKDDRGVLYVVASTMRLTHVDPCGLNGMWMSYDEGETWTPTMILHNSNFDDRDTGITYYGDGKLGITWFTSVNPGNWIHMQDQDWFSPPDKAFCLGFTNMLDYVDEKERIESNGSFVMLSKDYGVTWSDPIRVPITSPHGFSKCKDGSLVYMGKLLEYDEKYGADGSLYPIRLYTSFDDGYTWEFTGEVPIGEGISSYCHMHEPHVVELPSGRLLGTIRVHGRPNLIPEHTVYITFSDDKGKTWTTPKMIDESVDGVPPHVLIHSSGAIIVTYSYRSDEKPRAQKAIVSYDNGETWTENYILDTNIINQKDMGYPSTVELSDGSLLTVYYQAYKEDWYTSVLYTKWRLNNKK